MLNVERFNQLLREEIQNELLALSEHLAGLIQGNAPVGSSSHLRGSFVPFVVDALSGATVVKIGKPLDYGAYVEFGTQPHFLPASGIESLKRWVTAKFMPQGAIAIGVSFKSGTAKPVARGTIKLRGDARERMITQIAYAIAGKIAREGTKPQFFIKRAIEELGLKYKVLETPSELVYEIDVSDWILRMSPSLWQRIESKM